MALRDTPMLRCNDCFQAYQTIVAVARAHDQASAAKEDARRRIECIMAMEAKTDFIADGLQKFCGEGLELVRGSDRREL